MAATRLKFIEIATHQFAARGFYGVSIAQIAAEAGLSKQALLHHFRSKEKLYAEVLKTISDEFIQALPNSADDSAGTKEKIADAFCGFYRTARENSAVTSLLVRELLDNKRRSETADVWFLKPFLDSLVRLIQSDPKGKKIGELESLAFVYQLISIIHYFVISKPTLARMYEVKTYTALEKGYEDNIRSLIYARLS
ncbi:MAG: TetR/AcrR family transcriptional regulator [Pseudomonadota bacterium]